jgi:hypothetical protein
VQIDWAMLAVVAVVAAAAAVTVVLLVAFALVGLSTGVGRRVGGDGVASRARFDMGTALAVLCLLAAGLIVGYGLYLIIL